MAENQNNKPADDDDGGGVPEWVVTFGDMMSLLLTFFIMLFSMSTLQVEQTRKVIESLHDTFGSDLAKNAIPGDEAPANSAMPELASMGRARLLDVMRGGEKVKAPVGEYNRVEIMRPDQESGAGVALYFDFGSAMLKSAEERKLLDKINEKEGFGGKPNILRVEAHCSAKPLPDSSPYPTHMDLCYGRAKAVRQFLVENGIPEDHIELVVIGPSWPPTLDRSPEAIRKTDRVEVTMLQNRAEDRIGTQEGRDRKYTDSGAP